MYMFSSALCSSASLSTILSWVFCDLTTRWWQVLQNSSWSVIWPDGVLDSKNLPNCLNPRKTKIQAMSSWIYSRQSYWVNDGTWKGKESCWFLKLPLWLQETICARDWFWKNCKLQNMSGGNTNIFPLFLHCSQKYKITLQAQNLIGKVLPETQHDQCAIDFMQANQKIISQNGYLHTYSSLNHKKTGCLGVKSFFVFH